MKRFERSNGLDTALYKNYLYLFLPFHSTSVSVSIHFYLPCCHYYCCCLCCQEFEEEIVHLRHEFEEMKLSKERLQDEMGRLRMNYESDIAVVDEAAKTVGTGEGTVLRCNFRLIRLLLRAFSLSGVGA